MLLNQGLVFEVWVLFWLMHCRCAHPFTVYLHEITRKDNRLLQFNHTDLTHQVITRYSAFFYEGDIWLPGPIFISSDISWGKAFHLLGSLSRLTVAQLLQSYEQWCDWLREYLIITTPADLGYIYFHPALCMLCCGRCTMRLIIFLSRAQQYLSFFFIHLFFCPPCPLRGSI